MARIPRDLMYQIEITFGHCCADGNKLPVHEVDTIEQQALLVLAHFFKGAQSHSFTGSYLNSQDIGMIEPSTVLMAYTTEVDHFMCHLLTLAKEIALALHQECVLLVIKQVSGTFQWVKPADYSDTMLLLTGRQMQPVKPMLLMKQSESD